MGQHREPNPHPLRLGGEAAQPTPHRRHRHPQPPSRPAEPVTGCLGDQRKPDRPDRVPAAQQPVGAQQHMGPATTPAAGPARNHVPHPAAPDTQHPRASRPPRRQNTPATRALQPAIEQVALDFRRIGSYDLHQCPQGIRKSPPDCSSQRIAGGLLRVYKDASLTPTTPVTPLRPCPPSMSPTHPRVTNERGAQQQRPVMKPSSTSAICLRGRSGSGGTCRWLLSG